VSRFELSQLWLFPVKSCAGFTLQKSHLSLFGLAGDRRWMVVDDSSNHFISQRNFPEMCLIQASPTPQGVQLNHLDGSQLHVTQPQGEVLRDVTVWEDQCQAWDAGEAAANWLSERLATHCRLVYFPQHEVRQVDLKYAQLGDKTAFSDGFPLLLISQASLDDLNSRLESPVSMARFRPNLVVDGCEPFAEDSWKILRIGDITLRVVKPCSRCSIPNVDPTTGRRDKEPISTLSQYRRNGNKIFFGQNVIADKPGDLAVGMPVEVVE